MAGCTHKEDVHNFLLEFIRLLGKILTFPIPTVQKPGIARMTLDRLPSWMATLSPEAVCSQCVMILELWEKTWVTSPWTKLIWESQSLLEWMLLFSSSLQLFIFSTAFKTIDAKSLLMFTEIYCSSERSSRQKKPLKQALLIKLSLKRKWSLKPENLLRSSHQRVMSEMLTDRWNQRFTTENWIFVLMLD